MERLTEAERILKYGVIPEEEEGLLSFRKQHEVSITRYFITPFGEMHSASGGGQRSGFQCYQALFSKLETEFTRFTFTLIIHLYRNT